MRLNPHQFGEEHLVDVDWAHNKDTLKLGKLVGGTSRVSVLASHPEEARLVAEQMVAARGKEPTASRWVSARI